MTDLLKETVQTQPVVTADRRILADRYLLRRKVGEGAAGKVYEAEHLLIGRRVAVKVLHDHASQNPLMVSRFHQEARTCGSLRNPHICQALDFGQTAEGSHFLVMEFVEGHDLSQEVAQGPLKPTAALDVIAEVARGLQEAHSQGIVHRDLKPENLMRVASTGEIKIMDFGIAQVLGDPRQEDIASRLTTKGMVFGTPHYMSPEQACGEELDHRSDLYSLGVILFELLTGKTPFQSDSIARLMGYHVTEPPPSLLDVGFDGPYEPLQELLDELLEKIVDKRLPDTRVLLTRIQQVRDVLHQEQPGSTDAEPHHCEPPQHRFLRRSPPTWTLAAAALVVVVLGGLVWAGLSTEPIPAADYGETLAVSPGDAWTIPPQTNVDIALTAAENGIQRAHLAALYAVLTEPTRDPLEESLHQPVASPLVRRLTDFSRFTVVSHVDLEDMEIRNDPLFQQASLGFSQPLHPLAKHQWEQGLKRSSMVRSSRWSTDQTLEIDLVHRRDQVALVDTDDGLAVVIGELRDPGPLLPYLLGDRCSDTIPASLPEEISRELAVICEQDDPDWRHLRRLATTYDQNYLVGLFRRTNEVRDLESLQRLHRYVEAPGLSPETQQTGYLLLGLANWMVEQPQRALEYIARSHWSDELGPDLFESHLRQLLGADQESIVVAMGEVERYPSWITEDFPLDLHHEFGQLFRDVLMPRRAIPHYLALLDRTPDSPQLLEELAELYSEAGEYYKAYATAVFLQSRRQLSAL